MTLLPGQAMKGLPALVGLLMLAALIGCAPRSQPAARVVARASSAAVLASMEANRAAAQAEPLAELYEITDTDLSCEQAQQLAYRTVERMGYRVTSSDPGHARKNRNDTGATKTVGPDGAGPGDGSVSATGRACRCCLAQHTGRCL